MRRFALALGLALALVVPMALPAVAAVLHRPHQGTECPAGYVGTWHFVNNQTKGAAPGFLVASFVLDSGRTVRITVETYKRLRKVQHFNVPAEEGAQKLNTAVSFLPNGDRMPGKLVLSDFTCEEAKKKTST